MRKLADSIYLENIQEVKSILENEPNLIDEKDEREYDLYRIIRDYGEDRFAKNIAKHIVAARKEKPIETTFELNDIIKAAIPMKVSCISFLLIKCCWGHKAPFRQAL